MANYDLGYKNSELTASIAVAPYEPARLKQLGLFQEASVFRTHVDIEYKAGHLSLLSTRERGSRTAPFVRGDKGKIRTFRIPHIPQESVVRPDDLPDVRLWGTRDGKIAIRTVINDRLKQMKANFEATFEFHRMGAVNGVIIEPDGSEIYNLFDIFEIEQPTYYVDLENDTGRAVRALATDIKRDMPNAIGKAPYRGIHAFCGDDFFDAMIARAEMESAFERPGDGAFLRTNFAYSTLEYAGITWENYRGNVGDTNFIEPNEARLIPLGVPGLFIKRNGPDDTMSGVGRIGREITMTQEQMPHDAGLELRGQANTLHLCTRPSVLFKIINGVEPSGS